MNSKHSYKQLLSLLIISFFDVNVITINHFSKELEEIDCCHVRMNSDKLFDYIMFVWADNYLILNVKYSILAYNMDPLQ